MDVSLKIIQLFVFQSLKYFKKTLASCLYQEVWVTIANEQSGGEHLNMLECGYGWPPSRHHSHSPETLQY